MGAEGGGVLTFLAVVMWQLTTRQFRDGAQGLGGGGKVVTAKQTKYTITRRPSGGYRARWARGEGSFIDSPLRFSCSHILSK